MDQQETIAKLKEKGIFTNYGAQCIPAMKYYSEKYKHDIRAEFPHAWEAFTQGLALPIHTFLTDEEIDYIIDQINEL